MRSGSIQIIGTTTFALVIFSGAAVGAPPLVSNQTVDAGLGAPHMAFDDGLGVEFMTGGGAAGDFDNDGDLDLFVIGGSGTVDHLYINDGTGQFTDEGASWGVNRIHKGSGAAVGDFNNDGFLDIMVTSMGPADQLAIDANVLYRNNGDGTFTDIAASAGVSSHNAAIADAFSPAFGDYDLDGDLDLAVAGWYGGSALYRNNGDSTFTDVTSTALDADMGQMRAFAPRFVDMDGDLYPEILWVGDFYTSKYFVNNGDGTFTDQTTTSGTGLDSNGMGNTYGDYNNDGKFDWYVTSRVQLTGPGPGGSGNMLYQSTETDHVFEEVSVATGCNFGYWGWGAVSLDIDHDGNLDIFATNGFWNTGYTDNPSEMFLNDGTGNFVDIAGSCGMDDAGQGRGVIHGDFDGDGDQEILLINAREQHNYYRNDLTGSDINSITLDFDTSAVDNLAPNGFGTRVWIDSDSHNQLRYLDGGTNYLSQSELSIHAGLGSDPSADITIQWANGDVETFPNVDPGRYTIRALSCPADLTLDGTANFFDISEFLGLFNEEHPQSDLNHDGTHNFFDISAFLSIFAAGCP
ncbi:MAG: CRTAC1 family protein [Phycisphaerales bacterium]|nr:CRTAC1 family protein [Phycisphaerales bacterium]